MIWSHLETYSNKCAPLNVTSCANTTAPLSGIEPHSSALAKQFCQLGEPIHSLITDPSLMHQHTVEHFRNVHFHHCRHQPNLASFHSFRVKTSYRITMSPTLKFLLESKHLCLSCKVARNSLHHLL